MFARKSRIGCVCSVAVLTFLFSFSSAALDCEFDVTQSWGSGGNAQIAITNNDSNSQNVGDFSAEFSNGVSVGSSWHTGLSGNNPYIFTPNAWNNTIASGQTLYYGFSLNGPVSSSTQATLAGACAQTSGNQAPTAALNCQEIVAVPSPPPGGIMIGMETYALGCNNLSTDPDGDTLSASFDWGDGSTSNFDIHEYIESGTYTVTLTVSDGEFEDNASVTLEVRGNTLPPTAALECGLDGRTVTCDSSNSSDPDGDTLAGFFAWGDGSYSNGMFASHEYSTAGTYTVSAYVTDGHNMNSASEEIVIQEQNGPLAEFSYEVDGLTLYVDVPYDVTGGLRHNWDWGDGSENAQGFPQEHRYIQAGTYSVTLTVSDEAGRSDSLTQEVTVSDNSAVFPGLACALEFNSPFLAELIISNNSLLDLLEPWEVVLRFPEGTEVVNAANAEFEGSNPVTLSAPTWTPTIPGGDNNGGTILLSMSGAQAQPEFRGMCDPDAGPVNHRPSGGIGPIEISGLTISTSIQAEDADGDDLEYSWETGDGNVVAGQELVYSYAEAGTYSLVAYVSDGRTTHHNSRQVVIESENSAPIAAFTFSVDNDTVSFDASISNDPDNDVLNYAWDFGDGNTGSGQRLDHSYTSAGNYSVRLTVSDGEFTHTQTQTVQINLPEAGELSCRWSARNNFSSGFVYSIEIANAGSEIVSDWEVCLAFDENSAIDFPFNAESYLPTVYFGNWICFTPVDWNNHIQPGAAFSFGFMGTGPGEVVDVSGSCDTID